MEGNKLELSAKPVSDLPPATYKALRETDVEGEAVSRPKNVVKSNSNGPEADGADEKMLSEDKVAPNCNIDLADVKVSPNEKQNGDAKLDIGDLKSAFVGLTKEELMKYANDPFWVRLRWFLFITFWLLWAAMLFGAIAIIYAAPKCDPPPPRTWWQQGPLSEVQDDIKPDELKSLKDKGVQGVIVSWAQDAYTTLDPTHNFVTLMKTAKEQGVNVIVELEPGHSKVWFEQSEMRNPEFSDYYIWKQPKSFNGSGAPEPPNNWKTVANESAWVYSEGRKEFYYAPTGQPHLNFRNANVTEEFSDVIYKFLDAGAGGFRLKGVANLLVDNKFEDEGLKSAPGYFLTDYGFYTHTKTENLLDLGLLLQKWKSGLRTKLENGPLMAAEDLTNVEAYRVNGSFILDLPLESHLFTQPNLNASEIVRGLNTTFNVNNITWPLWKYNSSGVLDIVAFLLPGTPLIKEDAPINSELLKIRDSPSIMRGSFHYYQVANKTVFAFVRVTAGNPGILVAFNPTDSRVTVDFAREIPVVTEEVTVQLFSTNYSEPDIALNVKQDAHAIPISPKSAIVLSYVPKAT